MHLLVIPRRHVARVAESGYKAFTNTGPDAGQEVMHLHWHVIAGTPLGGMV